MKTNILNFAFSVLSYHIPESQILKSEVNLSSEIKDATKGFLLTSSEVTAALVLNHRSRFSIAEEYANTTFRIEYISFTESLDKTARLILERTSNLEKIRELSNRREVYDELINDLDKVAWLVMTVVDEANYYNV